MSWKFESMAVDPDWLNRWIEEHGPYGYHETPSVYVDPIEREGLKYDPDRRDVGLGGSAENYNYLWTPQKGYEHPRAQFRVDLRKLDPALFEFDADHANAIRDRQLTDPIDEGGWTYDTVPEYVAQHPEYQLPENVQQSMERGSIAYRGDVPPEALSRNPAHWSDPKNVEAYEEAVRRREESKAMEEAFWAEQRALPASFVGSQGDHHWTADGAVYRRTDGDPPIFGPTPHHQLPDEVKDAMAAQGIEEKGLRKLREDWRRTLQRDSAWDLDADWDEPPEDFLTQQSQHWTKGMNGKGLIGPNGEFTYWATNEYGEPHHDDVAQERNFPYVAKVDIFPSGFCCINSPDEENLFGIDRHTAEGLLAQIAPKYGLKFRPGFMSNARPDVRWHETLVAAVEQPEAVWTELVEFPAEGNERCLVTGSATDSDVWIPVGEVKHAHSIPDRPDSLMQYAEPVDPNHLDSYREYPWDKYDNRYGTDEWNALRDHVQRNGFMTPVCLEFNPDTGEAYVSEGNHRVGIAKELGVPVPTFVYRSTKTRVNGYPMRPLRRPGVFRMENAHGFSQFPQYAKPSQIELPIADPS